MRERERGGWGVERERATIQRIKRATHDTDRPPELRTRRRKPELDATNAKLKINNRQESIVASERTLTCPAVMKSFPLSWRVASACAVHFPFAVATSLPGLSPPRLDMNGAECLRGGRAGGRRPG